MYCNHCYNFEIDHQNATSISMNLTFRDTNLRKKTCNLHDNRRNGDAGKRKTTKCKKSFTFFVAKQGKQKSTGKISTQT